MPNRVIINDAILISKPSSSLNEEGTYASFLCSNEKSDKNGSTVLLPYWGSALEL